MNNSCLLGVVYMANNPLAEVQRESAGASTFGKYNFQFHWALCEIIEKHKKNQEYALLIEYQEYALLIEYQEDVVIANSLDPNNAQFEFYQVKNQIAKYTSASLTKRDKGKNNKLKNSVLGKLLSSCVNTSYENRVVKIGLVSSSGFSLNIDKDLKLDVIKIGDLAKDNLASFLLRI